MCHSVSGNGFSLIRLWKQFKQDDDELKQHIISFAKESVTIAPKIHQDGDHIFSLYEGLAGTLSFVGTVIADVLLLKQDQFSMPGFEV